MRTLSLLSITLVSALPTAIAGQAEHAGHGPSTGSRLGKVDFPTSARPAAQAEFLRGVLYLHSFEYESAAQAFKRAQALQPDFALAYWGEAMTYTHPVWNEQNMSAGRAVLGRLGATADARRAKAPTSRERAYLGAVEVLYGAGPKAGRDTLYAAAMERLVRDYPTDLDAKAFYALALLGLNQGVRDTIAYLRAAPYADSVFRANPEHPGAAHYLIHAYDDPLHAQYGLKAARAYARIAPDAAHAQHMTTHIFLAMGMWDDAVAQNQIAVGLTARVPGHYTSWLVYALIQQGRYAAAGELLEELRQKLKEDSPRPQYSALAEMRAHWLLHSEDWNSSLGRWRLPRDKMRPLGRLIDVVADAVGAYRRRDVTALGAAADEVAGLAELVGREYDSADPAAMAGRVMAGEVAAMRLSLSGNRDAALRALRDAAALQDAIPMEYGPPTVVEPAHELLGALLLEAEPKEALAHYRRALVLAPGRSRALLGLAQAALSAGDKLEAQRALDRLDANWHGADPEVRAAVAPLRQQVERMP